MQFDLVVAVGIIGTGWAVIVAALRRSMRRADPTETADEDLAAKTAPWRAGPDNRPADKFVLVRADGRV